MAASNHATINKFYQLQNISKLNKTWNCGPETCGFNGKQNYCLREHYTRVIKADF